MNSHENLHRTMQFEQKSGFIIGKLFVRESLVKILIVFHDLTDTDDLKVLLKNLFINPKHTHIRRID